jgi:hypothetical protein
VHTPWGESDHEKPYGEGITFYGTPSHGGFRLLAAQNQQIPGYFRKASFNGMGQSGWYEEDCDWAIVAVCFPELFTAEDLENARLTLKSYRPEQLERFESEKQPARQVGFGF